MPSPRLLPLAAGAVLLTGALGLYVSPASAGIFDFAKRKDRDDPAQKSDDTDAPSPQPARARKPPAQTPLWPDAPHLPVTLGRLPQGLANASAQGCAACHPHQHQAWSTSAHARGPSPELRAAAQAAGDPRCLSCHLPLDVQHRQHTVLDGGDPRTPVHGPNADFDATLSTEGVTCAACHLREGQVLSGHPPSDSAPHATSWNQGLSDARACAPCHQLSWPGADRPLYDTVGEYERSAYPDAGITCATCHLDSSAGHAMHLPKARAVSVLVELPPDAIVRGGAALTGRIVVQNTGAGHAFPTGSPWQGVRLQARVEGPEARGEGRTTWGEPTVVDFSRTLSDEAPWVTTQDTRIPAGGQQALALKVGVPLDAPRGPWELVTELVETRTTADGVEPIGEPFLEQRLPLVVQ